MSSASVHPLWRPFDPAATAVRASRRIAQRQVHVGGLERSRSWSAEVEVISALISSALGDRALLLEHVGSTAVSGLIAKPIIDLDLVVAAPADEGSWLPDLQEAGFRLIAREPEWEEHRCLTAGDPNTNLHVFAPDAVEPARHLVFREWLRAHPDDVEVYARAKTAGYGSADYNASKAGVVYDIYEKVFAADPEHPHDPHPRS